MPSKPEIHGGFALAHWNGSREVEEKIKNDLKVTIRCIPFGTHEEPGKCVITGEPSARRVVFAKSDQAAEGGSGQPLARTGGLFHMRNNPERWDRRSSASKDAPPQMTRLQRAARAR